MRKIMEEIILIILMFYLEILYNIYCMEIKQEVGIFFLAKLVRQHSPNIGQPVK